MKNLIFGIMTGTIVVFVIVLLLTVYHRNARLNELEHATMSTMEEVMTQAVQETEQAAKKSDYIAAIRQGIESRVQAKGTITIHIIQADFEKGLLSIESVEHFSYPIGKEGTVACMKTMILDKQADEEMAWK